MKHTFSELVALVDSPERGDKLHVKLALLVLGAASPASAVATGDLEKELRLRLRGRSPKNVSDVLRKSAPEVDCVASGNRSFRWFLTGTGLRRLAATLHLDEREMGLAPAVANDFDIALVCALHQPELGAVLDAFGGESAWKPGPTAGQPHIYKTIEYSAPQGPSLRLIAGAPTYMGLTATAILSTQMLLLFRPRVIAMVGIAAGTKTQQRSFGDILVADPSVDYASGKVSFVDGNEVFQPDPFPLPIDARVRTLVQEDVRTRATLDAISREWTKVRPPSPLRVHIGPVGAADQVVDSSQRIAEVQKNWRKLIGVEMETYALYRAAHEAPRPKPLYMSFKSVCDFAEGKADSWQEYAAFTAARYCRGFFERNWTKLIEQP